MMRLGISLQEGYLVILAGLIFLMGAGTIYGLWAAGRATTPEAAMRLAVVNSRVRMGWWLVITFTIAWWWGQTSLVVIFAILSFFLLREFIALTPIKHTDHWALVIAFYIVIPVQYALVYFNQMAFFTLFIPVYIFLILPVIAAMSQDTDRYLERIAKVQWGLMMCVFCVSHAPAIATINFERYNSSGALMLLFFLMVTFLADLLSVIASSALGGKALKTNPNKTVKGVSVGSLGAFLVGLALFWLTPFRFYQVVLYSLAIPLSNIMGDIVMSSVKRSLGSKSWEGDLYIGRGILERFAAFIFAAPVFYHLTILFFKLLKHLPVA